jgi:hypothetical protein
MKKTMRIFTLLLALLTVTSLSAQTFWTATSYKGAFPVTDGTPATDWTHGWSNFDPENTVYPTTSLTLSSDITTNTTLSGSVLLQNKVYVTNGATLTILPGTIIRGDLSTQGTLIITKGCKIIAEGTETQPIVFTSNESVGNRAEGDWGGLVILGQAINNQPGGVANIEGIAPTSNTEFGGNNDNDNSGSLKYVRVEFAGIPLAPNKEINGITFGSIGKSTQVDYIQVSFSGDDSFEWFGGTVDCKHLIAYKGIDDDFDTDFGYRGRLQFLLSVRSNTMYDAAGDSNSLESDNDATGSSNSPQTAAVFSNLTLVGPKGDGTTVLPVGETFAKSFRIRRNSSISVFNSLIVGWELGLSLEGGAVEDNFLGDTLSFSNNSFIEFNSGTNYVTATPTFYSPITLLNDTTSTISQISWVSAFTQTPDYRLDSTSVVATGADFTNSHFVGGFVSVNELIDENFIVYPNPTTEMIIIQSNSVRNVSVMDEFGRVVLTSKSNTIDVSNLSNGVYILRINNTTKKIIIRK